jgi:hypothetical protein
MTCPTAQYPTRDSRPIAVPFAFALNQQLHDGSRDVALDANAIDARATATALLLLLLRLLLRIRNGARACHGSRVNQKRRRDANRFEKKARAPLVSHVPATNNIRAEARVHSTMTTDRF